MSAITLLPGSPIAPAPLELGSATPSAPRAAPAADLSRPAPASPPALAPPPDLATVQRAATEIQQTMNTFAKEPRDVDLRYDDDHRLFVIEIRNRENGELILEYPPEKILNVRDRLDELIGAMIDRKI
jgi:hypothetical protein